MNHLTKLLLNECKNCTADHRADNLLDADSDGKILLSIRNWDPEKDGVLDYSNLEEFMRFLDKYAKHNINGNMLTGVRVLASLRPPSQRGIPTASTSYSVTDGTAEESGLSPSRIAPG